MVTNGTTPILSTTAGTLLGDLAANGHIFTQELQASPGASEAWVTATVGQYVANVHVRFVRVDQQHSTLVVDPETTVLGAHATVTATLRDNLGAPVTGLGPVVIESTLGSLQGSALNLGGGVFTQDFIAGQTGTAQITAHVDGLLLGDTAALDVREPAQFGAVVGWEANYTSHSYSSIQEAVNKAVTHHLVHIFVNPGNYRETVKIKNRHDLVIEGLVGSIPVSVKGFRLDDCQNVTLIGFDVDAKGNHSQGIKLSGGEHANSGISILDCGVSGSGYTVHHEVEADDDHEGEHESEQNRAGISIDAGNGAVLIEDCSVTDCAGNGLEFAQGGLYTIRWCTIGGNGWNGLSVDKGVSTLIRNCAITDNGRAGDVKRGYGILRQRVSGSGNPSWITLIDNTLSGNRGKVVPNRSTANLGNYDQVIDPTDSQTSY